MSQQVAPPPEADFFDPNYDSDAAGLGESSPSGLPCYEGRKERVGPTPTMGPEIRPHLLTSALVRRLHDSFSILMLIREDDSPYPEVRAAVANYDDPEMPVSTFRAWTLGVIWSVLLPAVNQFFYFRYPSITVTSVCRSGLE